MRSAHAFEGEAPPSFSSIMARPGRWLAAQQIACGLLMPAGFLPALCSSLPPVDRLERRGSHAARYMIIDRRGFDRSALQSPPRSPSKIQIVDDFARVEGLISHGARQGSRTHLSPIGETSQMNAAELLKVGKRSIELTNCRMRYSNGG